MIVPTPIVLTFTVWFLTITASTAETRQIRLALLRFMTRLSPGNRSMLSGWNMSSDPCLDEWTGVVCDFKSSSVTGIKLDGFNLSGTIDANSLCSVVTSLFTLILSSNSLVGELPQEISKCTNLIHLNLHQNLLSGDLPSSLSQLNYMIKLDISNNGFTGQLPDLSKFVFLVYFHAEQNRFSGEIPELSKFGLMLDFNVSDNNLSGPIPGGGQRFDATSFSGNPGLCGPPLSIACVNATVHHGTSFSTGALLTPVIQLLIFLICCSLGVPFLYPKDKR
ncbi:hypothetical protein C2S52_021999 [Perilla frutescens var. hirtella]|nr:hypothetical protein C2S52_021999 [Perilla frutescens var. hirtella]KAH6807589.1 hypothetical protein C2S51_028697 [Perilla frutescens var. frutescens]